MAKFSKKRTRIGKNTEMVEVTIGDARLRMPAHKVKGLRRKLGRSYKEQQRSMSMSAWNLVLPQ